MRVYWVSWKYTTGDVARAGGMSVQADSESQARERVGQAMAKRWGPAFQAERLTILRVVETGIIHHETI